MFAMLKRKSEMQPKQAVKTTHEVAGRSIALVVTENSRAKRLTLRIQTGGRGLKVTHPPGISMAEINQFLDRQAGWLENKFAIMPDRPILRPNVKVPIRGVPHLIVHGHGRGITETGMTEEGTPCLKVYGALEHVPRRVADFLKKEAKRDIEILVARHAQQVGIKPKSIQYKDTSSRWGSCSSARNLSFSWRIMMAPPAVINYLVAHEVAHLKEMNHGPKFWALCTELCPDTQRCKTWLKRNGSKLQAISFAT